LSGDLLPITVAEMINEIEREIGLREWVYPGLVERKKLRQAKADRQIAIMRAVLDHLKSLPA
jgi:hypothetical protein